MRSTFRLNPSEKMGAAFTILLLNSTCSWLIAPRRRLRGCRLLALAFYGILMRAYTCAAGASDCTKCPDGTDSPYGKSLLCRTQAYIPRKGRGEEGFSIGVGPYSRGLKEGTCSTRPCAPNDAAPHSGQSKLQTPSQLVLAAQAVTRADGCCFRCPAFGREEASDARVARAGTGGGSR